MSVKSRLDRLEQSTAQVRFMVWTSTPEDSEIFENGDGVTASEDQIAALTSRGVKPIIVAYVDESPKENRALLAGLIKAF